jgi:hypothetical protein
MPYQASHDVQLPFPSFAKDDSMTAEFLKENIFPSLELDLEAVGAIMDEYAGILNHANSQAWGPEELVAFLNEGGIDKEEHTAAWAKIWKNEHVKAHEKLVQQCTWTNTLQNISWRIDLLSSKTSAKDAETEGLPETDAVALINLATRSASGSDSSVLLELDRADLKRLLAQLGAVEAAINKRAQ